MPNSTVEERLEQLESRVAKLEEELRAARGRSKDWRRTIGAFTDDDGMHAILREAIRLRESDRKKADAKRRGNTNLPNESTLE